MIHLVGPRGCGKTYWAIQQALYQDAILVCRNPRITAALANEEYQFNILPGMMSYEDYIKALSGRVDDRLFMPEKVVIDDIDSLCKVLGTEIVAYTQGNDYDQAYIDFCDNLTYQQRKKKEFKERYYKWGNTNDENN